jgi:hypothetical protein
MRTTERDRERQREIESNEMSVPRGAEAWRLSSGVWTRALFGCMARVGMRARVRACLHVARMWHVGTSAFMIAHVLRYMSCVHTSVLSSGPWNRWQSLYGGGGDGGGGDGGGDGEVAITPVYCATRCTQEPPARCV